MLKKFLIFNATASLLTISTSSVVSLTIPLKQTKPAAFEFTHPNFTENLYFNNEMQKALVDYRNDNEEHSFHTHAVNIANVEDGFFFPVGNQITLKKQIAEKEVIFRNDSDFVQEIKISQAKLVNQSFPSDLEKRIPPHTVIKTKYVLNQTTFSQIYNFMLPIENDKWCRKNIGVSGKVYQITPRELVEEIKDDSALLEYYFGLNEFYQYKDFIGKNDSEYLVWAATRIITENIEEKWTEVPN